MVAQDLIPWRRCVFGQYGKTEARREAQLGGHRVDLGCSLDLAHAQVVNGCLDLAVRRREPSGLARGDDELLLDDLEQHPFEGLALAPQQTRKLGETLTSSLTPTAIVVELFLCVPSIIVSNWLHLSDWASSGRVRLGCRVIGAGKRSCPEGPVLGPHGPGNPRNKGLSAWLAG